MKHCRPIIVQRELGKAPICRRTEIERRLCSTANFWETNLQGEHRERELNKAFRSPAPCAVAIPNLPVNPGLCSNLAVAALRRGLPVTSPFLCAVFSPARRSNSLECPSQPTTVVKSRLKTVFTLTQPSQGFNKYALAFPNGDCKTVVGMNQSGFIKQRLHAKTVWRQTPSANLSKFSNPIPHICRQRFGDFLQRRNCEFHSISSESRLKKSSSIEGTLSLGGQSAWGSTRSALARQSNSKSETHRSCVSILARVCRLKSHPQRRQRAANNGCVNPCWSRNRRICGPTTLRGFFVMFRFQNQNTRGLATYKGSEFRTIPLLTSSGRPLGLQTKMD